MSHVIEWKRVGNHRFQKRIVERHYELRKWDMRTGTNGFKVVDRIYPVAIVPERSVVQHLPPHRA